mgnify:CR=1 FL=1
MCKDVVASFLETISRSVNTHRNPGGATHPTAFVCIKVKDSSVCDSVQKTKNEESHYPKPERCIDSLVSNHVCNYLRAFQPAPTEIKLPNVATYKIDGSPG